MQRRVECRNVRRRNERGDFMRVGNRNRPMPGHRSRASTPEHMVLWAGGLLFAVVAALSSATPAQGLMTITNASIFAGNSGARILQLPVNFAVPPGSTTNPTTV